MKWRLVSGLCVVLGICNAAPHGALQVVNDGPVDDVACIQMDFMCRGKATIAAPGDTFEAFAQKFGCDVRENNPHIPTNSQPKPCDEICLPFHEDECSEEEYAAIYTASSAPVEVSDFQETSFVIPKPVMQVLGTGSFTFDTNTAIVATDECYSVAVQVAELLRPPMGFAFQIVQPSQRNNDFTNAIVLSIDTPTLLGNPEAYDLVIDGNSVVMKSSTTAGLFYALQTLRQLLPAEIESKSVVSTSWSVPAITINDAPTYKWRGLMFDVSRHYFNSTDVKHLLDLMALHKLNVFHWHITDDQGWRLPVPNHPEITDKGAWRKTNTSGQLYGGFYSLEELVDVLMYARQLHIDVIPELDMPGHSQALLVSHPEVGNHLTTPVEVATQWGISNYTLDPTNPLTYGMVRELIQTVATLFSSSYFHVGGDEANPIQWKSNPNVTDLMQRLNFTSYDQVQGYFEERVSRMVIEEGKKLVGWNELLRGGLPPNSTLMSWQGMNPGIEAAKEGHEVVMCPTDHAYFDRKYRPQDTLGRLGVLPLNQTYLWDPRSAANITADIAPFIIGAQGTIWTEGMSTMEEVEFLSIPRTSALAEVAWTPLKQRDYSSFFTRAQVLAQRMQRLGVQYPLE